MAVNIDGIDKVTLLMKLWEAKAPATFFQTMSGTMAPSFDKEKAGKAVGGYIDYFQGRRIKTDISGTTANPTSYDSYTHPGAFEEIVDKAGNMTEREAKKDIERLKTPKYYECPGGEGKYMPYGEAMLPGDPGTVLCVTCPYLLKQHKPIY
jgi:hypothetical protein